MRRSEEDRKKYNSYMNKYMSNLYQRKRLKVIEYMGGRCVKCNGINNLQIDHKDHTNKSFSLAKCWSYKWERIVEEISKCQLLCHQCHLNKTINEGSLTKSWSTKPRFIHGSLWTYKKHKCRCEECIKGYQVYLKIRREKQMRSRND